MKHYIKASETTREDLMDYLEEYYNRDFQTGDELFNVINEVRGYELPDYSTDEGIYEGLSLYQLQQVIDIMDANHNRDNRTTKSISFTDEELRVLTIAMTDFSDVKFTKDPEMSRTARSILRKI